jgi:Cd2+/Zn2+-exporting ATPase
MALLTATCAAVLALAFLGDRLGILPLPIVVAFAVVAYLAGGGFSGARAIGELARGQLSIDLLMVTAAVGAASVGAWAEGGILLFLFSLSNTLEKFALHRTRRAIEALLDLRPQEATVRRDGRDERIPTAALVVGDVVIVRPGERIPADGVVVAGMSSVDQSPMTGESVPVDKVIGDQVFAGTLNQEGALEVKATRPPNDTTLQRIIRLVEVAQSEKAESQRFTEERKGREPALHRLVRAALHDRRVLRRSAGDRGSVAHPWREPVDGVLPGDDDSGRRLAVRRGHLDSRRNSVGDRAWRSGRNIVQGGSPPRACGYDPHGCL